MPKYCVCLVCLPDFAWWELLVYNYNRIHQLRAFTALRIRDTTLEPFGLHIQSFPALNFS